jgi:hypothetical protein
MKMPALRKVINDVFNVDTILSLLLTKPFKYFCEIQYYNIIRDVIRLFQLLAKGTLAD